MVIVVFVLGLAIVALLALIIGGLIRSNHKLDAGGRRQPKHTSTTAGRSN